MEAYSFTDKEALHWWKGTCGCLSLSTFIALLIVYFTDTAIGFVPVSGTDFRTGGLTDEIGWEQVEHDDTLDASWVFVTLFAIASAVSGIYYCGLFLAPESWSGLKEQVEANFNRHRWFRRGLTEPLLFVSVSYVASISNAFVITAVAVVTVLLNLNQSANEAIYLGGASRASGSLSWLPRIEFYGGATLAALYVFVSWWVYYGTGDAAAGGLSGWVPATVFTVSILYLLFHLVAVNVYVSFAEGAYSWSKEYVYDVFEALQLHLTVWFVIAGLNTA